MDNGSKYKLQDSIEAAQRADAVVYVLVVYDPREGNAEGVARKLTDETGGRTIVVRSEKNLEAAFEEISEELRTQYLLSYYPTNSTHDGGFRKIKLEMANHDQHVLTRKGYYAPKQ
jgi:VWFA-related protein